MDNDLIVELRPLAGKEAVGGALQLAIVREHVHPQRGQILSALGGQVALSVHIQLVGGQLDGVALPVQHPAQL